MSIKQALHFFKNFGGSLTTKGAEDDSEEVGVLLCELDLLIPDALHLVSLIRLLC